MYDVTAGFDGEVEAIHLAADEGAPVFSVDEVRAVPGRGLEGDRYFNLAGTFSRKQDPGREVTLVEAEAIDAVADDYDIELEPGATRRNITTRGVPLNHLVGRDFAVGEVVLRGIRLCDPCGLLERRTEPGAKAALTHRGGLNAQIVEPGVIRRGDRIRPATSTP
ncbi:MAG: MOSC domain-containing protein [Actinomycetota bacterium]